MNKILIIAGLSAIACTSAKASALLPNCCGACPFNSSASACTQNCCYAKYGKLNGAQTYSSPDANGIITVTTYKESVTCATSSSGSNFVACTKTTSYICDKGYYGNPTVSNKTCTPCPSSGTTADTGATKVTECYIPSGSSFSDGTGSGTYTGNCYY